MHKRLSVSLAVLGMLVFLGTAALFPTMALANRTNQRGSKMVIVSGGAAQSDLHLNWLNAFGDFERAHPEIARDFNRHPLLVCNQEFRSSHPEWATFLKEHAALRADIEANPGNYLVIPPRLASVYRQHQPTNTAARKAS